MKHTIPLGTAVTFKGDSQIYIVDNYQTLLGPCEKDCPHDHDCYEEAYINVRKQYWTAFPISQLEMVFVDHIGYPYKLEVIP